MRSQWRLIDIDWNLYFRSFLGAILGGFLTFFTDVPTASLVSIASALRLETVLDT